MNNEILPKVLEYVQLSSIFGKRAMEALQQKEASDRQAAAHIPTLLDRMVETGAIASYQRKIAADMLQNHAATLQLLKNAVDKIEELTQKKKKEKKPGEIGKPAPSPEAPQESSSCAGGSDSGCKSADWSLHSPFVGLRTSEKKASDYVLLRSLGLE